MIIKNITYVLLTLMVITISGNPATAILDKEMIYVGALLIFLIWWAFNPLKLTRRDALIFALFSFLTLMQFLTFGSMVILASLGFLVKLGVAMFAVRLVPEFRRYYVSVMYVLSLISFFFWLPSFLGVDMQHLFSAIQLNSGSLSNSIGIYNFTSYASVRNAGMFWEPGAFAGYLMLALFFLVCSERRRHILRREGLVLIFALLSTQSTTGYLAFIVLVAFSVYNAQWAKGKAMKLTLFPAALILLVVAAYTLASNVSFMGDKIRAQIATAADQSDASKITRFGNLLYDLNWVYQRPILGWSADPQTRFTADPNAAYLIEGQGNGLSGFAVRFGLAGLLAFIGFFVFATRQMTGLLSASLFGAIIVCMLLSGEQFLNFPVFMSLMFLPRSWPKRTTLGVYSAMKIESIAPAPTAS